MTVTLKLNNLIVRIVLVVAGLFVVLLTARFLFSHFLLRNIADQRIVLSREALASAYIGQPNSPRILFRLAGVELEESATEPQRLSDAQSHALKAAQLSPWDFKNWRLLGMAQDAGDNLEEATRSMQIASRLAVNNSDANWMLANLLLRQNNQAESLKVFQRATRASNDLLPAAMEVVWQAFNNDIDVLSSLVGGDVNAKLMLAQFLLEQTQADAAIKVFRGIEASAKLNSPEASSFISRLTLAERAGDARQLWVEIVGGSVRGANSGGLMWNGSFEITSPKDFGHFDWLLKPSNYARIGFDRSIFKDGQKSLRLSFAGKDTTKLENEIQQLVVLNPNRKYRLECFAKAGNLVTPEGPRIALFGKTGMMAVSEPVSADTSDWQRLVIEFTTPPENVIARVAIVRIPRLEYEEPTRGTVWFDDFKLTEQ